MFCYMRVVRCVQYSAACQQTFRNRRGAICWTLRAIICTLEYVIDPHLTIFLAAVIMIWYIVNELGATHKHFVLMGDCNYRYQSWPPVLNDHRISVEASQFLANVNSSSCSLFVIDGPSVVCRLWRWCTLLRRLKFSAIFLRHVVPWPSMNFV